MTNVVVAFHSVCGPAGIFSSPVAVEICAQIFDQEGAVDKLEGFCSIHGQTFYNLSVSTKKIRLFREDWTVPLTYPLGSDAEVRPMMAGEIIHWKIDGKVYE